MIAFTVVMVVAFVLMVLAVRRFNE